MMSSPALCFLSFLVPPSCQFHHIWCLRVSVCYGFMCWNSISWLYNLLFFFIIAIDCTPVVSSTRKVDPWYPGPVHGVNASSALLRLNQGTGERRATSSSHVRSVSRRKLRFDWRRYPNSNFVPRLIFPLASTLLRPSPGSN